tara:strand:+ start:681 stop:944 length:264 start_codon:yes stop_codon:yes gene_type:complete
MSWEDIIKRGKSYGRKKRVAEHNKPILDIIQELEKEAEDYGVELSTLGTSQQIERYGFEAQMEKVRELESIIRKLKDKIREQKDKLK